MWQRMLNTSNDWTPTLLRGALGLVMVPHGAQKLFGWFGGYGLEGTLGYFNSIGIPTAIGLLVVLAEFFGGLALLAGFLTRFSAASIAAVMVGAVFLGGHLANGFFMNWSGQLAGVGFEFHILAVAIALALTLKGAGAASVDRLLSRGRDTGVDIPVRHVDRELEPVGR